MTDGVDIATMTLAEEECKKDNHASLLGIDSSFVRSHRETEVIIERTISARSSQVSTISSNLCKSSE